MSFLSFSFYVIIAYILYYTVIISHDLLTGKLKKSTIGEGSVHYDFGPVPAPRVAVLDENENDSGDLENTVYITEDLDTEDLYQGNEVEEHVDLTLEDTNQQGLKNNTYKY